MSTAPAQQPSRAEQPHLMGRSTRGEDPGAVDHARPAGTRSPWRPIVSGPLGERALRAVDGIATASSKPSTGERRDPSLSGGLSGLAVLHAFLERAEGSGRHEDLARSYLGESIELLAAQPLGASLYAGFTGVAWAAELVDGLLGSDGDDPNEAIDDLLSRLLARPDWDRASYDLIYGLTGLGVYALQRWPRPSAADHLELVVERLRERARHDEYGSYWWTSPALFLNPSQQERYPSGGVDLGVAHGVAGVIALLACVHRLGLAEATTYPLLLGAVRWLLRHAVPTGTGPTIPYLIAPGVPSVPARSAWCYGDPGVAAALLLASHSTGDAALERTAVALACRAAERPIGETGATDGGFCHGSAGLAHLFNRMYQATREPKLADAALLWLERTLEQCEHAEGELTVRPGQARRDVPWNGAGLLEGAAGVALALLAAVTPIEPVWDRMFLVSGPDPEVGNGR